MADTDFGGYLLKSGNDEMPMQYINWNTYDSSPNQREEIKAERDDNTRNLIRVTADGMKTAIHFQTRDGMHLAEKRAFLKWFTDHESNAKERKLSLTFWNDETDGGRYITAYFYRANIKFPIKKITDNDIIYGSADVDLIEY